MMKMNEVYWYIIIGITVSNWWCSFALSETVVFHRGQTVRLPCNTTHRNYVQWNHRRNIRENYVGVYENGQIDESYKRFSVEYPLIIRNAAAEDEGYYSCLEDAGSGRESVGYHLKFEESAQTTATTAAAAVYHSHGATKTTPDQNCWTWIIVGISIAVFVCVVTFSMIIFLCYRHRWYMKRQKHVNNDITKLEETKRLTQRNETLDQNNHELIEEPSTCTLQQNIINLQQTIGEKEQQNNALDQMKQDLEKTVRCLEGDKNNLDTEFKSLRGKYDSLEKEMKDKSKKIDDMTKELDKHKDELTSRSVELVKTKTELENARDQISKLNDQISKLDSKLQQSKKKSKEYRHKSGDLEVQLAEANIHLEYLRQDYPYLSKKQGSVDDGNRPGTPARGAQKVSPEDEDIVESAPTAPTSSQPQVVTPPPANQAQASLEDKRDSMPASFKSIFEDKRVKLKEKIKVTDDLLRELQTRHILTQQNIDHITAGQSGDERMERLLAQLEQCEAGLLLEFYGALTTAGQPEIVGLLREG